MIFNKGTITAILAFALGVSAPTLFLGQALRRLRDENFRLKTASTLFAEVAKADQERQVDGSTPAFEDHLPLTQVVSNLRATNAALLNQVRVANRPQDKTVEIEGRNPVDEVSLPLTKLPPESWDEAGSATPTDTIRSLLRATASSDTDRRTALIAPAPDSSSQRQFTPGNLNQVSSISLFDTNERSDGTTHVGAIIEHQIEYLNGQKQSYWAPVIWVLTPTPEGWRVSDMLR